MWLYYGFCLVVCTRYPKWTTILFFLTLQITAGLFILSRISIKVCILLRNIEELMRLQKALTPLWWLHLRRSNNKRGVAAMSKRSRVQIIPNFFWQNSQAYWSLSVSTDYGRLMKPFLNNITSFSANWADRPNNFWGIWGIWGIFTPILAVWIPCP